MEADRRAVPVGGYPVGQRRAGLSEATERIEARDVAELPGRRRGEGPPQVRRFRSISSK